MPRSNQLLSRKTRQDIESELKCLDEGENLVSWLKAFFSENIHENPNKHRILSTFCQDCTVAHREFMASQGRCFRCAK